MAKYGPEKAKLLFTDTDSLTSQIKTDDLYQDMLEDQDLFDTSNYPREHPLYSSANQKVIGEFKDETGGLPIVEWVGLRAKMYSMVTEGGKEKKTGKGIKKSVRHQDFKDCLLESREYQHSMMGFQSQRHQLFTVKRTKKSSCPFDDERLILEDGCMTRAHGHWRNAIARPSQDLLKQNHPRKDDLFESMTALSLSKSNTDVQEPSTVDSSDAQESSTVYSTDLNGYSFSWGVYSVTARFSK